MVRFPSTDDCKMELAKFLERKGSMTAEDHPPAPGMKQRKTGIIFPSVP
jgi:hypothetical protein